MQNGSARFIKVYVSRVIALVLFISLISVPAVTSAATVITKVSTTAAGKAYLEVGGKPFNPIAVQLRVDRAVWYGGKTLADTAAFYTDAKNQGFNTISVPIPWSQMEPTQNNYDWTWLDSYITNSKNNGLKLEIIWFGINVAGGGCSNFLPSYITSNTSVYARHSNSDGSIFSYNHDQDGTCTGYSLADSDTLNREKAALQAMMNHLGSFDTTHTTIGIQVNNESMVNALACSNGGPWDRSYDADTTAAYNASGYTNGAAFAEYQLAVYQNQLAQVIKQSDYSVYTRMNYWCQNASIINNLLTYAPNIDFWGNDPYTSEINNIRNSIDPSTKFLSISENSTYANTPYLELAAYDKGAVHYDIYQLVFQSIDGEGMVGLDHTWRPTATTIVNANNQITKEPYLTSYTSGTDISYFYNPSQTSSETKSIGFDVNFSTSNYGLGIALKTSNDIMLMGLGGGGTFKVTNRIPSSADVGYYNANHNWVSTGSKSITNNTDGTFSVAVSGTEYVKLHYNNGIPAGPTNLALNATASTTSNNGYYPTSKVNDGTSAGIVSTDNPGFPQYVTLNWSAGQSFNAVKLSSNYAQGQAPTNWDIQVSADGSTNWTTVASSGAVSWSTNGSTESREISFNEVTNKKGVRIKINNANLTWSHYAIEELAVYNHNLALFAIPSTTSNDGQFPTSNINDGTTAPIVSNNNPGFPQYVTLNWGVGQSVSAVNLATNYAQGQAPTNWDIQVSTDGSTNWTTVASSGAVTWLTNGATESRQLSFTPVANVKGVRIKMNSANLTWSHYALQEIEVFN
ncbi:discoidin domain-containing protein [Paenibacillus sp. FSL H8-0034]|uniref:discoidin domain-containing protein n=1 Tax=Paenibacillus sp. FSL H8-0034 TaxID=2954671 RepID=UPI0030F9C777